MINRRAGRDSVAVVIALLLCALARPATAGIINGDFQTGDLTGWTASAIDGGGDPVTPLISVGGTAPGNRFAVFDTGDFATGPFISTLEQSFLVDAARPFLSFDFSMPIPIGDPTGTGASSAPDAFFVSLQRGIDSFVLLQLDRDDGPLADPFGTAPGTVALGAPLASGFDFTFSADLSSLVGENVTLFAEMFNEDDGFQSFVWLDNVETRAALLKKAIIPEPAAGTLWGAWIVMGVGVHAWQCRRRSARGGMMVPAVPVAK